VTDGYVANLEGLECRWQEIPPDDDEITSYIIKAIGKDDKENSVIYEKCLQKIDEVDSGFRLIQVLSKQLEADFNYCEGDEENTFTLQFKKSERGGAGSHFL